VRSIAERPVLSGRKSEPLLLSEPLITLLAGPTASGKSRCALEMAARTGAVIVNADSQQLYADLRVLSARPSVEEEAMAEHRLYGIADAADSWSVGRWSRAVMPVLTGLAAERRPVVLVGGTGLYFTSLTKGLADIPDVPVEVRDAAGADFDAGGEAEFRRRLAEIDPAAEARIEAGDRQRLTRAWAVARHTGRALSDWTADTTPLLTPGSWTGLVIEPEREALYANCDRRVAQMVETGALEEVRALVARGLDPALPAMKAVGVREFAAHLAGEASLAAAVEATRQATRNYAKRQLTWFRNQTPGWARHPEYP
jgi:tRNA dimethylallyltransferase